MANFTSMNDFSSIAISNTLAVFGIRESCLSPCHPCVINYRGQAFTSLYQLVLYFKARFFKKAALAESILASSDLHVLTSLSRQLSSNDASWEAGLRGTLQCAARELLLQSMPALGELLATGTQKIVFAHPDELYWGSGLHPAEHDRDSGLTSWPGKNIYGETLRDLRDSMFKSLTVLLPKPTAPVALDAERIEEIVELTSSWFSIASDLYDREFSVPIISFKLRGAKAGVAYSPMPPAEAMIRYNPVLLSENWEHFRKVVVPHEVAHIVAYVKHGNGVKPHGHEWQSIMRDFGCDASIYHTYDVANASQTKTKRRIYACGCKTTLLTPRVASSSKERTCKFCKTALQFVADEAELLTAIYSA